VSLFPSSVGIKEEDVVEDPKPSSLPAKFEELLSIVRVFADMRLFCHDTSTRRPLIGTRHRPGTRRQTMMTSTKDDRCIVDCCRASQLLSTAATKQKTTYTNGICSYSKSLVGCKHSLASSLVKSEN